MTTPQFLSIKEAADMAGVSKKTVERAYRKHLDDPKLGKLIEKRKVGKSIRYFVAREFVEKCVLDTSAPSPNSERFSKSDDVAVLALKHQLEVKDRRIDELMEMLSTTNKFSEDLVRKGLALPASGNVSTDAPSEAEEGTAVGASQDSEESNDTRKAVIDAEVFTPGQRTAPANHTTYFPTFSKGFTRLSSLLSKEIV